MYKCFTFPCFIDNDVQNTQKLVTSVRHYFK